MDTDRILKKVVGAAMLAGGVAVAGMGLAVGPAHAQLGAGPLMHSFLPEDGPVPPGASGPYTCCPEDQ